MWSLKSSLQLRSLELAPFLRLFAVGFVSLKRCGKDKDKESQQSSSTRNRVPERIPGGTRENDGLEIGIMGGLRPRE